MTPPAAQSQYILQDESKTWCMRCDSRMHLLCHHDRVPSAVRPWFWICFNCKTVVEVGKGDVRYDGNKETV